MNTCNLSGRLTWDPQLRYQSSGKPELSLRVAVPNGERDGKRFYLPFDVTVFGHACELLAESLERDDLVELTGQTTWPKPSKKPGGAAIPAVVCFSVTKLAGSLSGEHEPSPAYSTEADAPAVPTEAAEPVAGPRGKKRRLKTQGPGWKSQLREPWLPAEQN
jgi:single-stranded DNA-binding protein